MKFNKWFQRQRIKKPDIVMNIGYFHSIYIEKYCLAKEKKWDGFKKRETKYFYF